jgi:putative ABC transport system permease protein
MIKFILRYIFRSFRRNLFYHLINIAGLVIAFTSVFYILIWINLETGYDNFHPAGDRLYRFTVEFQRGDHHAHFARTWQHWTADMPGYFPEIESMVRLQSMRNSRIKVGERKFMSRQFYLADSIYFHVFGQRLIKGNPAFVLREPRSMVLSESLAETYFGDEDPVGKVLQAAHQFDSIYHDFTVTGVMEDPPVNAHCKIDMLAPVDYTDEDMGWAFVYFLLARGADPGKMLARFPEFLGQYMDSVQVAELTPHLQAVRDIHLHSDKDREIEQNNKAIYVYVFATVGIVFLAIVFINNANLQLAMINGKMRFIFLNRVAAVIIILLTVPCFNAYFGYSLQVNNPLVWAQIAGLAMLLSWLGIVFGILPVLMLGIKERLHYLSGRVFYQTGYGILEKGQGSLGRKMLIVIQFSASVILILMTLFINLQLRFMLKSGIGSGQPDIIVMRNLPRPALDKYTLFKEALLKNPLVREVSASIDEPSNVLMDAMRFEMDGMDESLRDQFIGVLPVDDNFLEFYGIRLLAGRTFPPYGGMEAREHFIINETALEMLGFESSDQAIGRPFELIFGWPDIFKGGSIEGVVEDFNFYTMAVKIKPVVMFQKHIWFWCFLIRVDADHFRDAIDFVSRQWDEMYPDYPFRYEGVDELYERIYRREIVQSRILGLIAVFTMIIACLGMVGLMHYLAGTRTREIGIRKVNGAKVSHILILLNRDFLVMVMVAIVTGIPVTWYLVRSWLENFVYRIEIKWWIILLTGAGFLMAALLTVTYQSWKAASRNPVSSLRYE